MNWKLVQRNYRIKHKNLEMENMREIENQKDQSVSIKTLKERMGEWKYMRTKESLKNFRIM